MTQPNHSRVDLRGSVIGPYRIVGRLGAGGFGHVYSACEDGDSEERFALKIYPALGHEDANLRDRFLREYQIASRLKHPNLARVIALIPSDAHGHVLVMELVRGQALDAVLLSNSRMSLNDAAVIINDIASGLDHLHSFEVVHRDVKPANVVFTGTEPVNESETVERGVY